MNKLQPVFTELTECQDCYKCIRSCPVKAIRVENSSAVVMPEQCLACGKCVQVCPVGAKRVRDDLQRVQVMLRMKQRVVVSLAPSYSTEFAECQPNQVIAALKQLGFEAVSETALGAQAVSSAVASMLEHAEPDSLLLSSACPSAVELIRRFHPDWSGHITPVLSPMLAHCRYLRQVFGDEVHVVFIGPCIAKKLEADAFSEVVDAALTFRELHHWLDEEGVVPADLIPEPADQFVPESAEEGAMYPIEGGMVAGIRRHCAVNEPQFMVFSGVENIRHALKDIAQLDLSQPMLVELLACEGGCINGPQSSSQEKTVIKRHHVLKHTPYKGDQIPRPASALDISSTYLPTPIEVAMHSEIALRDALRAVGKESDADELNCGGCGYDNCRQFAAALLDSKAEQSMCVSYMRQLAQNKANALIRAMPSAVVIVDDKLKIIEANRQFADLIGGDLPDVFEVCPGLAHASLTKLVPFTGLFQSVLDHAKDLLDQEVALGDRYLQVSIFSIEPYRLVGGILADVTQPAISKQAIIRKSQEVIERNLKTVQQIACLLGENAAESEVILNSIVRSFGDDHTRID